MTDRPRGGTSYHNHPGYCDGSGTVAEYAEAALQAGLVGLGISSHAPVPFVCDWTMPAAALPAYRAEVEAARATYRARLPIFLGLELDFLDPAAFPEAAAFQRETIFAGGLDYVVASVHFVGYDANGQPWAVDEPGESFPRQLREVYGGDVRRLVEDYYALVAAMARTVPSWGRPVIVGHIDKVKMWNVGACYFREDADWYVAAVDEALAAVAAAGLVVEINTAGLGRAHGEPYPGPAVLRRCRTVGIPVTISSDAHQPGNVARHFDTAEAMLKEAGYREVAMLTPEGWARRTLL